MTPRVSIIMGSSSDLSIMEKAAQFLNDFEIPFEMKVASAHRTPHETMEFVENAHERGIKVIIAGAGGAAHLPGVVASFTHLPVIGVPINASISMDGWDSILSILQMPPGIPVATVSLDGSRNAAILATQILAGSDDKILEQVKQYKASMRDKIAKANESLKEQKYSYKVN